MFSAVLFDLGGVLVFYGDAEIDVRTMNLRGLRRIHEHLTAQGYALPSPETFCTALDAQIQEYWRHCFDHMEGLNLRDLLWHELMKHGVHLPLAEHAVCWDIFHETISPSLSLDEDATRTLEQLRTKGLRLGVVTNTIWPLAVHLKYLSRWEVLDYFDCLVCSSEVGIVKPHSAIFEQALRVLNAEPEQAVFVGDRTFEDVFGPHQLGMKTILRRLPYRENTFEAETDRSITALKELPMLLAGDWGTEGGATVELTSLSPGGAGSEASTADRAQATQAFSVLVADRQKNLADRASVGPEFDLSLIEGAFGLSIEKCIPVREDLRWIYKILSSEGVYALKIFSPILPKEMVLFVSSLMKTLKDKGLQQIPLARPITESHRGTKLNPYVLQGRDGRYCVLTRWLDGAPFDGKLEQLHSAGAFLGRYHKVMQDVTIDHMFVAELTRRFPPASHPDPDAEHHFDLGSFVEQARHGKGEIDAFILKNHTYVKQKICELKARLHAQVTSNTATRTGGLRGLPSPYLITHGDFRPDNVLFDADNHVCGIFDFDEARYQERVCDLAWALKQFCPGEAGVIDADRAITFLQAYQQTNFLLLEELSLIVDALRGRCIELIYLHSLLYYQTGQSRLPFMHDYLDTLRWLDRHEPDLIKAFHQALACDQSFLLPTQTNAGSPVVADIGQTEKLNRTELNYMHEASQQEQTMLRVMELARQDERIQGVGVSGSSGAAYADRYSDIDFMLVVDKDRADEFNALMIEWMRQFGETIVTHKRKSVKGIASAIHRVLYANGTICDFLLTTMEELGPNPFHKRTQVLVDKTGAFSRFIQAQKQIEFHCNVGRQFGERVTAFWFDCAKVCASLHRGEIWHAMATLNKMREHLFVLLHLHAKGGAFDPGEAVAKGLEKINSTGINANLTKTVALYDEEALWTAFQWTVNIFCQVTRNLANKHNLVIPFDQGKLVQIVDGWIGKRTLKEC